MGPKRELKFALESFWDGKSSAEDLQKVAADLRSSIWTQMTDVGIKYIPSNTFSYYDQVLDTTAMLGLVPSRYNWNDGEIGFDTYFFMARGNGSVPAMEMTKWFETNYHFIVPELGSDVKFSYASHKAVTEYKEAKALGVDTVPVFVGPELQSACSGLMFSLRPTSLMFLQKLQSACFGLMFSYASHKAVTEYKEAKALGVDTIPVFVGPELQSACSGLMFSLRPTSH